MNKSSKEINKIYVLSHTHWDREWYQDFQGFRTRLVYMLDELIETMEKDPEYRFFTMDGQTIVLDDYLEIRPENRGRLQKLIQDGRIAIGPWYVMPDEFLVSGESLIRNLAKGTRQSRAWGVEPMKSGYVTDIFGHNSQFPQLLQGFGIDNAVLFRGFRGAGDPAELWWEGADGSRVLGLKLDEDRSYSDFYFALRWPFYDRDNKYADNKAELIERAIKLLEYKNKRATTDIALGMDGVDHVEIDPQLPWILETLNNSEELGVEFVHAHLEDYLQELRSKVGELEVFKGEQKALGFNGVNNWVPENTLSSRIHLKQHNQNCENLLERWAEPFGVITSAAGRPYSKSFLAKSWEFLIQNHPHDSICGCSIHQVHQDMMYRFDQSRSISEQMIKEELLFISDHLDEKLLNGNQAFTVFNPTQSIIDGVIRVEIKLPVNTDAAVALKDLKGTSFRIYDHEHNEVAYQLLEIKPNSIHMFRPYRELPRADMVDRYQIAFPANIAAYGYATYTLEKYKIEFPATPEYSGDRFVAPVRHLGAMQVDENTWDNGRVILEAGTNGTITITDKNTGHIHSGLLMFEDEADIGDGWSHIAPLKNETIRSTGTQATISTVFDGRFQTRIRIQISLRVPKSIENGEYSRSAEFVELPITTYIELRWNDPIVYCRTVVMNTARDHRFRLILPTGLKAAHYHTSTPFDLVKREIKQTDKSDHLRKDFEVAPHNGIVTVDDQQLGLAVYSKGLYEVAVRDNKQRSIALTLFRSTRKEVMTDGGDGGQLLGELEFEYAIRPFELNESYQGQLWREHQQYVTGIRSVDRKPGKLFVDTPHSRQSDLPLSDSFLSIDSESLIVSALKISEDHADRYILRLFNVSDKQAEGTISFKQAIAAAQLVNLDEQVINELSFSDNILKVTAEAKQIITIQIAFK